MYLINARNMKHFNKSVVMLLAIMLWVGRTLSKICYFSFLSQNIVRISA